MHIIYPYKFNSIVGLLLKHNLSKPEAKYHLNTKNNITVSLEKNPNYFILCTNYFSV